MFNVFPPCRICRLILIELVYVCGQVRWYVACSKYDRSFHEQCFPSMKKLYASTGRQVYGIFH
ncbi:hypothetical protein ACS0TY_019412 [Phlomoides rotata]